MSIQDLESDLRVSGNGNGPIYKCLCGRVTTHLCGDIWPPVQLQLCTEPLCETGCVKHRHAAGSMGYPTMGGTTQYEGDEPDGDGVWELLKSWYRETFWSPLKKATSTYREICDNFPAPAPWPTVQLIVRRKRFECRGGVVTPVTEFSTRYPRSF